MLETVITLIKSLMSLWFVWVMVIAIAVLPRIWEVIKYYFMYNKSKYKDESGIGFVKFYFDKGCFGEGLTFMKLEKLKQYGKIMTNLYIPTEDGTTEIDLIYISKKGIYVIESKNYSGWIYGSEKYQEWMQSLYKNSRKNKFFNPIWQNKKHIEYLSKQVDVPLHSLIVFSERCNLKKLYYDKTKAQILRRHYINDYLNAELSNEAILSNEDIDNVYENLKKFRLASDFTKDQHVEKIVDKIKYKLLLLSDKYDEEIYNMYQDIPKEELGSINKLNGCTKEQFLQYLKWWKREETEVSPKIYTTTNRYIFYVDGRPIGELGIRTTLNDFWINKGSQLFYKIKVTERNKGYGSKMLEFGLRECKKLGMQNVRINCSDFNIASKRIIEKNGGVLDIASFETQTGTSSSYVIRLD